MSNLRSKTYSNKLKIGVSLIVVAIVAIASIVTAAIVLPKVAPIADSTVPEIAAIVADNDGLIAVGADLTKVFATIKYVDGSDKKVPLSELIVSGLDTSSPTVLNNVLIDYGGFKQSVKYEVVPTSIEIEYVASTGGRVEGDAFQSVPAGTDASRVLAVPDEGYKFLKWNDDNPNPSRMDKKVSASKRIVAIFEKRRYSVVFFYPDGTTAREEIVAYNETPSKVPRATETNMRMYGYKFVGFDKDYLSITDHTDIYPLYEKYATDTTLSYTLDVIDGTPLGTSDVIDYYEKDTVAAIRVLANPDRLFVGWSIMTVDKVWIDLQPSGEQRLIKVGVDHNIEFRTSRTGTSEEYVLNFTPDEEVDDLYIKAHFVYLNSQVSFTSMSTKVKEPILISHNQPIGEFLDVDDLSYLTMLGYEFKGWAEKNGELDEFGNPIIIDNSHTFSQPTELVAQWEKKVYEVIFLRGDSENIDFLAEANGYNPSVGGKVIKAYYQDSLAGALEGAFPTENMTLTNHTFKGWYLLGDDSLVTTQPVDKTYKIDRAVTYVVPVFEINKVKLNIKILEGAGTIVRLQPDLENPLVDVEVAIRGILSMEVNKDHKFRVRASSGYKLTQIKIGDVTIDFSTDQETYDFTISSPLTDREVSMTFKIAKYDVTVNNGGAGTSGTITYNDAGLDGSQESEGGIGYISSDDTIVHFYANYGASKNIEILSQEGYYISSVVVNGVAKLVPSLATYYTVTLSDIDKNYTVNVVYRDFRYRVTLPNVGEMENGQVELLEPQIDYAKNSNPRIEIIASEGFFIKSVKANGWVIETYQPIAGYSTSSIEVLGEPIAEDVKDPRVTYYILTIDLIQRDVTIEVEFATVYYNILVSSEGSGTADKNKQVLHGGNIDINAATPEGYYISAVQIDGISESLVGLHTSLVHTLVNVTKDTSIHFVFTLRRKAVTFSPNAEIDVIYKNVRYSTILGKTFNGISIGSSATFTIVAKTGSQIDSVQFWTSVNTTVQEEIIAFSATSHVLQLDNIQEDYQVTVFAKPLHAEYSLYVGNKKASVLLANGIDIGSSIEYSSTLVQGSTLTIEVQPNIGQEFFIDKVVVLNKDRNNSYSYTRQNFRDPTILEGQYFIDTSGGNNTYLIIENVGSDIDIFVSFSDYKPSYDIYLVPPTNGTLQATILVGEVPVEVDDTSVVPSGTKVTFSMTPNHGYYLLALLINGEKVDFGIVEGKYIVTMGTQSLTVAAIFEKNRFNVSIDSADANGSVTTSTTIFSEGESFQVKITARKGYTIKTFSFTVLGNPEVNYPIDTGSNQRVFVYDIPIENTIANITIQATFEPNSFLFGIDKTGNGTLNQDLGTRDVKYGDAFSVYINADDNHFIESIRFNGLIISPFDLYDTTESMEIDGIQSGYLNFTITENTELFVVFKANEYKINLTMDVNGSSLFKKVSQDGVSSQFMDSSELYCNTGDELWIKMASNPGYHVAKLFINGDENTSWKSAATRDNELTEIYFKMISSVSGNVRVQVVYEVNVYSIKMNASNISVNYKNFDTTPQDYGTVSIVGYLPNANNEYTGFAHGTSVRVFIQPRVVRGYYIHRFSISFADGTERVIGDLEMPRSGGSYIIQNIVTDIDEVRVEFRRQLYTFSLEHLVEQLGAPFEWQGSVYTVFTNPYQKSAEIVLVDGIYYEFGTTFEMYLTPGTGYSRTEFLFNGADRDSSVRANKYTGVITSNIAANVEFTINTYTINSEQNSGGKVKIYDEGNNLLWTQGIVILESGDAQPTSGEYVHSEVTTTRGHFWIYENRIVATYDSFLKILAIPNNATNGVFDQGYRVSSFNINGVAMGVSGDVAATAEYYIKNDLRVVSAYSVNRYSLEILAFEGGSVTFSSDDVIWDGSSTVNITMSKGYYVSFVKINGTINEDMRASLTSSSKYTIINIREKKVIEIKMERNAYDVIFDPTGDYKKVFSINNGEKTLTAVSWAGLNENVPNRIAQIFKSNDGTILETGYIKAVASNGDYIGLRYGDKLIFHLSIPVGFQIESISARMDDEGHSETVILSSEAGIDADDGSGTRTFTILNVTGNVKFYVKYKIKTYSVNYTIAANGEFVDMNITTVTHHEKITWELQASYGYYLTQLDINGIAYRVSSNTLTYAKVDSPSGKIYRYSTDTRNLQDQLVQKEIMDAFLNGSKSIRITPYFAPLTFNVAIQINNSIFNNNLQVSIHNNRITYDPLLKINFNHTLDAGYSIKEIKFANSDAYNFQAYQLQLNDDEVLENWEFNPKDTILSINAYGQLFDIMDYHSPYESLVRVSYLVEIDKHTCDFAFHLIQGELLDGEVFVNKGTSFSSDGTIPKIDEITPAFGVLREFSDSIAPGVPHQYGVYGLFNASVDPLAQTKYEFAGFQELVNGVWSYVTPSTQHIELLSNGKTMRVHLVSDRQFRAVYFRLYTVRVEVHPEFKYVQGSFATSEPNLMNYKLYSSVFASAQHYANLANGVVLPNIPESYVDLVDTDYEDLDGKYEFLVRSGATLSVRTVDRSPTVNASRSYVYYDVVKNESYYSQGLGIIDYERGVQILKDKVVYCYARNNVYLSFAMETEGAQQANAGGTVTYHVNGAASALINNSLIISPDSTVEVTIKPNANYRFDAISSLQYMAKGSADGYRRSSGAYAPLVSTLDEQTTVVYYDILNNPVNPATYQGRIATVKILMKNVAENAIFKIKFWKQIEFTRVVTIMTDEGMPTNAVNLRPSYFVTETSEAGTYDFGDLVSLQLSIPSPAYTGWDVRWQFVGFVVNGVNLHRNLSQIYPTETSLNLKLDNSAYITEKFVGGKLVFAVDIVARFIPVYNVVIENEYVYPLENEDDIYLDPRYITYSVTTYRSDTIKYTKDSGIIDAKQDENDHNEYAFKMLGKINTSTGVKENPTSGYNTWVNNEITLNWAGAALAGPTYKFLGWQYYKYDSNTQSYSWAYIPYVKELGGSQGTMDYKRPQYTFPISSLVNSSYYSIFTNEGNVVPSAAKTSVWIYDSEQGWIETTEVAAIRIRPLFQKVVPIEVLKEAASEEENVFSVQGASSIRPVIVENSLTSANFEYYKTINLDPALRTGYEFNGWFLVVNGDYVKLEDVNPLALKQVGTTDVYLTYMYTAGNNRLQVRLDWLEGSYSIVARYTRIFTITIEVVSSSGNSPYIINALPKVEFYGQAVKNGVLWEDPVSVQTTNRKVTFTSRVGNRLVFKLDTGYDPAMPNDWTKFNPRFDKLERVEAMEANLDIDMWVTSDNLISTGVILGDNDPDSLESAVYRIAANGDKYVKIYIRSEAELIIHNVYVNSFVRLPDALAVAMNLKSQGSTEKIYVKDNGDQDQDPTLGIIQLKNIPIKPGVNYDGISPGDFGNRLSPYLTTNSVLSGDIYQRGIQLNGNNLTSKLAQFAYYGEKNNVLTGYTPAGAEIREKLTSPITEFPFASGDTVDAGDGSAEKPFRIATLIQLKNIDLLYNGNLIDGYPTLRYTTQSQTFNLNFVLIASIDLKQGDLVLSSPLCSNGNGFDGILSGYQDSITNHCLYNLDISSSNGNSAGIFARITNNGRVSDIDLGSFSVGGGATYAGAIAGYASDGAIIQNIKTNDTGVFNPNNTRNSSGNKHAGGVVGFITKGASVINCHMFNNTVSTSYATYLSEYSKAATYEPGGAGGIVGTVGSEILPQGSKSSVVDSSVNKTTLIGKYGLGGVIGSMFSSQSSSENINANNLVATDVQFSTDSDGYVGGVIGYVGFNNFVTDLHLYANTKDTTIYSKWSSSAFTTPEEPACFQYGGGGIAGLNFGTISEVSVEGDYKVNLLGSFSGGVVGINGGTLINSSTTVQFRVDRQRAGNVRSGIFGGQVGYNRASGIIIGASSSYTPENYSTVFGENSALITVITENGLVSWAENFDIEIPPENKSSPVAGDNPGSDISNLYIGGIVGYNRGQISSNTYYDDDEHLQVEQATQFNGKIIVSRRSNAEAENTSYVGLLVGFNDTATSVSDTYANIDAKIEYYRYNFVGYHAHNNIVPFIFMNDYLGLYGHKFGSGQVIIPSAGTRTVLARYEANGNGMSDHTPASGRWGGYVQATGFPISKIRLYTNNITLTLQNPISVTMTPLENNYSHTYLGPNIHREGTPGIYSFDYYGKYRQTQVNP